MHKKLIPYVILGILIIIPYVGVFFLYKWYNDKLDKIDNSTVVLIDKEQMNLSVIDYHGAVKSIFPIACGKNYGNKNIVGDMKTPEGMFRISDIEEASSWTHDFKDGKGEIDGAYGPWFLRLDVPNQKGIGIHGTHLPESIGTRATEGCIRLRNEDVAELKKMVTIGTPVIINPSNEDCLVNINDSTQHPNSNTLKKDTLKNINK